MLLVSNGNDSNWQHPILFSMVTSSIQDQLQISKRWGYALLLSHQIKDFQNDPILFVKKWFAVRVWALFWNNFNEWPPTFCSVSSWK